MRGVRSTAALAVILLGLTAYIYFFASKESTGAGDTKEHVFAGLQPDKIDELRIKSASGDVTTLKKGSSGWEIVQPIQTRADDGEVSSVTSTLGSVEIQRVVETQPSNLKDFGLESPRIDVGFKAAGDKDYRHLLIGDKTVTNADMFAKTGANARVVTVPAFTESSFNRGTFDLRDKTVLRFDRDKVEGIDVASGGKTVDLQRKGGDWHVTQPINVPADYGTAEGLVGRLQTLQMKSIVATDPTPADIKKYGLDKPQATVTLALGSARASLEIGSSADDSALYARDSSKPTVFTVEKALLDDLKKGADDYRRKDIFEFRAFNATHFEITRGGQTIVFDQVKGSGTDGNKWRRVSPNPADVSKDTMDAMLTRWANLRAASFVDSTAKTGLDKPSATVVVKFDDGAKEERVTFGQSGSDVYAARPGEPGAAKVDSTDYTQAVKAVDEIK